MSFNTASGKYYCNRKFLEWFLHIHKVSIPQAVSTIAIDPITMMKVMTNRPSVSIPQAVSTIAIKRFWGVFSCKNDKVSIPQAVSTIAIIINYLPKR